MKNIINFYAVIFLISLYFFSFTQSIYSQSLTTPLGLLKKVSPDPDLQVSLRDTTAKYSQLSEEVQKTISVTSSKIIYFLPASIVQLEQFYGQPKSSIFTNVLFSFNNNSAAVRAELLSDYIFIGGRYIRVGMTGLVENSKDTLDSDLNRFFNSGGNLMLYFHLPLFGYFHQTKNESFVYFHDDLRFDISLVPQISSDIPALNSVITNPKWKTDIGLEVGALMNTINDTFRFIMQARLAYAFSNQPFIASLVEENRKAFAYGKFTFGLDIGSIYRLTISNYFFAPAKVKDNFPLSFGLQIIPNL